MVMHEQTDGSEYPAPIFPIGNLDRLKGQLLPIVAHELRQPLTAILFALENAHDRTTDRLAAERLRDVARREAVHMSRIIDDVLDIYLDKQGRLKLHLEEADLASIVHDAIGTTEPFLSSRGHSLSVSLPPEPVCFLADCSRLHQVLTNLLSNAARYTDPRGHIYLCADATAESIIIRVRDSGQGIPPERIGTIFEPFQCLDESGKRKSQGLGIGLSLVKSLVDLHGGSVRAQSRGWGLGSEFIVELPWRTAGSYVRLS